MAEKLLSICVPTYNRAHILRSTLEGICSVAAQNGVLVAVSDNGSTDDTQQVVSEMQRAFPGVILYNRNPVNLGPDANFEKVLRMTDTRYHWLLGDSNQLTDGALEQIIGMLEESTPDLLVINRSRPIKGIPSGIYTSADDLLGELGWHMTNIPSLIIGHDIVRTIDFTRYYNTCFVHFGVIFEYLGRKEKINVRWDERVFINRSPLGEGSCWFPYKVWEIFAQKWTQTLLSLPAQLSLEAKLRCLRAHQEHTHVLGLKNVLNHRSYGAFNYSVYRRLRVYIPYVSGYPRWIYAMIGLWPLFLNPFTLYRAVMHLIGLGSGSKAKDGKK